MKRPAFIVSLAAIMALLWPRAFAAEEAQRERTCTYEVAVWNVPAKSILEVRAVSHPYAALSHEERDPITGCTVCREDQVRVSLPTVNAFSICRRIAPGVKKALLELIEGGFPVLSVRGYQVVRSRGEIDGRGNRTVLSNHSFGTAIDINRELNGLYDNCHAFGPGCRLVLGGPWRPGEHGTLLGDGPAVRAMKELGFKWGGEIPGRQKDFMHFSLTGY